MRKKKFRHALKNNYIDIIINTFVITIITTIVITIFFKLENTIYVYDFSGHWIRSLRLRKLFFEDPASILKTVYNSMNYDDYSYLPALFSLWSMLFKTSYGYFCLISFINFLLPIVLILQILYFSYFPRHKYLPIIIFFTLYPLYITLFNGEVDLGGMFFAIATIMLVIVPDFESIDILDNIFINVLGFVMIFFRRWYLYSLIAIYLCYFIKYLINYKKQLLTKAGFTAFIKILISGLLMLVTILLFFRPFFINVLTNNYSEAYSFYNRDGKIFELINYLSPLILIVSIYGFYKLFTDKKPLCLLFIISIILPTSMFWSIQSFEHHHYYIILPYVLFAYTIGMYKLFDREKISIVVSCILLLQSLLVFTNTRALPLFTRVRKTPEVMEYKDQVIELTCYLKSIITEDWQSALMASSSSVLSDDMIRNSILPDLDAPQIDTAVLDLRDGFPRDMQYIQYVITIDPIQYLDKDYQHIYDIISNAIWHEPIVKDVYSEIYNTKVDNLHVVIYEKTGIYTDEIKEYFYNEILHYYPDKADFFSYILD